ncbi:hypothetical protein [Bacteroides sp. UBA939]|uniref:hypothetical protein n=1 Tax=Bacteroides sp. UBA939 TaxID=1946092 RepID=UPI0025C1DCF5|nr:hypothetical protein [Bacteroides sp. UBA939]
MKNKIFTINNFKIRFKTVILGLLSLLLLGIPFVMKDFMGASFFIISIIMMIIVVSFTFIQSCIIQYQYNQFDKQTRVIIECDSGNIKYIRNNHFVEFHINDITNFYRVRYENSRRLQEFFYQIYIKDKTIPLTITCVLANNLEKYIKKKCLVRITDSLFLDKDEYDLVLEMDYKMKSL